METVPELLVSPTLTNLLDMMQVTGGLRYEGLETKLFQIATDTETGAEAKVSGEIMRVIALSIISKSVVIL